MDNFLQAMEVSGVEGSYRSTCERTMSVLRENRDSLVAMLEAFVYDPLISFRLLGNNSKPNPRDSDTSSVSVVKKNTASSSFVVEPNLSRNPRRSERDLIQDTIHEEHTGDEYEYDECHAIEVDPEYSNTWTQNKESASTLNKDKLSSKSKSMYLNIQTMAATTSASNHIANSISESKLVDRSYKQREMISVDMGGTNTETMNEKALKVIRRVQEKLTGTDFNSDTESGETLTVQDQVQRLIVQATSTENLVSLFVGWCAFW
jgi:FKBP12-rapamycin complex-associated protein